jgi:hypothetical protein
VFGKIARSLAVVAIAGAPFVMSTPAHAAGGCTVDNTSTSTNVHVTIEIPPVPPAISVSWSNLQCSYVSEGGDVDFGCTITGRCQVLQNGVVVGQCITAGSCTGHIVAQPGDTISLLVNGGSGYVRDRV